MLISVFSPKGGSGTTVSSVLVAKSLMDFGQVVVIDACKGDLETVLNVDPCPPYGFDDWIISPEPSAHSLAQIAAEIAPNLDCITGQGSREFHKQSEDVQYHSNSELIIAALKNSDSHCVVDLGKCSNKIQNDIAEVSDLVIMVMRPCYLALSSATKRHGSETINACVVIREPGRSISTQAIAQTLNIQAVLEIDARRDFARTIDAGVLLQRTPQAMIKPFIDYIDDVMGGNSILATKQILDTENTRDNSLPVHDIFADQQDVNHSSFWGDSRSQKTASQRSHFGSSAYSSHIKKTLRG